jgi:hypothetical protein
VSSETSLAFTEAPNKFAALAGHERWFSRMAR